MLLKTMYASSHIQAFLMKTKTAMNSESMRYNRSFLIGIIYDRIDGCVGSRIKFVCNGCVRIIYTANILDAIVFLYCAQ